MVAINYAKDIRVGEQPVKAAALGSYFVWPPLPERLFLRGQSLAYDFVRQRYGVRLPDGSIDYTTNVNDLGILTRASTGTYWGPSGTLLEAAVDEARIQHDPVTGEPLGVLIESSATNTAPNSENFSWVASSGSNGIIYFREENIPDPSGGFNVTRVIKTGSNARFARISYASGLTRSIYARTVSGEGSVYLLMMNGVSGSVRFVLDETWRRFEIPNAIHSQLHLVDFRGGSTLEEVLIWGFQSEDSPAATSFIPTTDSPVTRAADNAVIDLSDVFNPDEGTLRITAQVPEGGVVASLGDRHVISDSDEPKSYDLNYILHSGNTVAQLGEGIFNKVEYFPAMQGEVDLEILIRGLFGNGEQGAIYIPKPKVLGQQVLWQDVGGTVPVTADGDPVGLMLDLSGNGNHATQSTSAARPIYRTDGTLHWLEFDGVDDLLMLPPSALSLYTSAMFARQYFAARPQGDGTATIISGSMVPHSTSTVWLNANLSMTRAGAEGRWNEDDGYITSSRVQRSGSADVVVTFEWGGAQGVTRVRENGSPLSETTPYQAGEPTFDGAARSAAIGAQGDKKFPYTGRLYGAIYQVNVEGDGRESPENYLAKLAGVTL